MENHRAAVATLARSRNYVWIVRGQAACQESCEQLLCMQEREEEAGEATDGNVERGALDCLPTMVSSQS